MKKRFSKTIFWVIGIPTLYALILRFIFGIDRLHDLFDIMSFSFLCLSPFIVGVLTIYFSSIEQTAKLWYRIFAPWVPVYGFFIVTVMLSWEGVACWIMILPVFLTASSIGGLVAAYFKLRKRNNKLSISLLVLLPLLMSSIESQVDFAPGVYEAYTYIDIKASTDKIWQNVTRVKEIPVEMDKGWLTRTLGFPRPIKAELDSLGVGGSREAIFSGGLVFHETVTEYIDQRSMSFTIKAYPHEIPSTTMDEHIVIGGKYFDVLTGTYQIQKLSASVCRLHLYSRFKLKTSFNFYASWWAKWIMKDIQNNILQVEKIRSESLLPIE